MWKVALCYSIALAALCAGTDYPPTIIKSPDKDVTFEIGNSIQLPCVADGNPPPDYSWEYNDQEYLASGTDERVVMLRDSGTLLFNNPNDLDQGYYKCFATNALGKAVADTAYMLNASLGVFVKRDRSRSSTGGKPLRLPCQRPESYPEATIIWEKRNTAGQFRIIDYNERIAIDPDGGLNFAHLQSVDTGAYKCSADNAKLRKSQSSGITTLTVTGDSTTQSKPRISWASPTTEIFIKGNQASIKCIFSGNPTPNIEWKRTDGKEISIRAQYRSYNQELYFNSIEYEDAGNYECNGYSTAESIPATSTVLIQVKGHPEWVSKPVPLTKGENETVTFICKGKADPPVAPTMWFKNGEPITSSVGNMILGDDQGSSTTLTIKNLKKERDTMALQCNITNFLSGGWIHQSFYLNVQSEMPTIVDFDEGSFKWAATKSYNLTCKVFGAPTPLISWSKNGQPLTGGRFTTHDDGTLQVEDVGITDAGTYTCSAVNPLGAEEKSTKVLVRRPTQIQNAPEDLTVIAGTQAKFVCTALTDPDEAQNLVLRWKKDGNPIDYTINTRMFRNVQDNSLQIAGPTALDSGTYTCSASNGIDTAEARATLRVQDRPEQPSSVTIENCETAAATVKWSPGANNNSPMLNFIIQYQTHHDPSVWYTAFSNVPPKTKQIEVPLKPFNNYYFRVLARNKIGTSKPSYKTTVSCDTQADKPKVNPSGVKTLDEGDTKLVITWQPLTQIDFGGESFDYVAQWKRRGESNCHLQGETRNEWCTEALPAREGNLGRPGELNLVEYKVERDNEPTYQAYEIRVMSRNEKGDAAVVPKPIIGYSGEGDPTQIVQDFRVKQKGNASLVFSDNATFTWTGVDESDTLTKGFFRGYRISYKKVVENTEEFFDTRAIYIILRNVKEEGNQNMAERILEQNDYGAVEENGRVTVTVPNLPPLSKLEFMISVINKRRSGIDTAPITVNTKEGLPGPVGNLHITENGPTHIILSWSYPVEPNGQIIQYMVAYKTIDGLKLGPLQYPDERIRTYASNVAVMTAKVTGLRPLQMYRFFVWAYTRAGQGSEYFIDDSTIAAGYPGAPTIDVQVLEDENSTLRVSWIPSPVGIPANVFYVQYKQESAIDQWQRTGWEINNRYILMNTFEDGWRYEIRVVASNGGIYETASASVKVYPSSVSRSTAEAKEVFSSAWFIGLLLLLIILAVVFVLVFIVHQNKGGVYTNHFAAEETERLRPYEESTFDEKSARGPDSRVYEPETPVSEKFRPPPTGDEYMQDDPSRYGEEGSFIGQYREKQELPQIPRGVRSDPYQPSQPRSRQPPSESHYQGVGRSQQPVPGPRTSQSSMQERRPPPRPIAPKSYTAPHADYHPANEYSSDTRYRTVISPNEEDAEPSGTQTVV